MTYHCRFPTSSLEKAFGKTLSKIPSKFRTNILQALEKLVENPRPFGSKSFKKIKPPIELEQYLASYRLRIGPYRILYDIDDDHKIIWILALRKRDERTYRSFIF